MKTPRPRKKLAGAGKLDRFGLSSDICRLLVERVKDYAIFMLDTDGYVVSWNEGAERIKGYTAEEIIGEHMSRFYTAEDAERGLPESLLTIARADGRVEDEGWRVRKDGNRFWADVVVTALREDNGTLVGFGKVTRDLTQRRLAEQQLGEMSGRLLQLQDEERRRIATELHDSTSPLLTRLTARLYGMRQRQGNEDTELTRSMDETLTLAEATTNMVRTVSNLLNPPMLEEAGLLASLHWFIDAFSSRSGMRVDAHLPDIMPRPPREQEVALFRLTQEWLGSMQRSGYTAAWLRLMMGKDKLELRIEARERDRVVARSDRRDPVDASVVIAHTQRIRQLGGRLDLDREAVAITALLPVRGSTRSSRATS
ncbi:MAG TPA: PAS domain S-box protein [Gemmatimonadales bacterium]|jgi:PAS domain S-box-containing protein